MNSPNITKNINFILLFILEERLKPLGVLHQTIVESHLAIHLNARSCIDYLKMRKYNHNFL